MKRKVITLLLLFFLLALIPLLIYLSRRVAVFQPKAAGSATMMLSGPTSVGIGTTSFDVTIIVNTGGSSVQSRGFDISLTFPTTNLQLLDIVPIANSVLKTYTPVNTTTYDFDKTTVISKANSGQGLEFSAIPVVKSSVAGYIIPTVGAGTPTPIFVPANPTPNLNYVSGSVNLVTLKFKPLVVGNATIAFNFKVEPTPGWRNDTNVSSFSLDSQGLSTDLLASVTNLTVNVTGTATNTPTPTNTLTLTPTMTPTSTLTSTPSPTLTSTPSPTKTPTPTATVTPSVTLTPTPACPNGDLGNLNCSADGFINEADLSIMLRKWATSAPVPTPGAGQRPADIAPGTGDGLVNEIDLSKMLKNWKTQ